jgi:hypothetical protein
VSVLLWLLNVLSIFNALFTYDPESSYSYLIVSINGKSAYLQLYYLRHFRKRLDIFVSLSGFASWQIKAQKFKYYRFQTCDKSILYLETLNRKIGWK